MGRSVVEDGRVVMTIPWVEIGISAVAGIAVESVLLEPTVDVSVLLELTVDVYVLLELTVDVSALISVTCVVVALVEVTGDVLFKITADELESLPSENMQSEVRLL